MLQAVNARERALASIDTPMTTRLTLLTHAPPPTADATRFARDPPAEPRGLERIAGAIGRLSGFDAIWRSPARAASETAMALSLDATPEPLLQDREHGQWSGRKLADVAATDPEGLTAWLTDPTAAPPDGESALDVMARLAPWLAARIVSPARTLAITHPSIVRACIVLGLAIPAAAWFQIDIGYGSKTTMTYAGSFWRIGLVNGPL